MGTGAPSAASLNAQATTGLSNGLATTGLDASGNLVAGMGTTAAPASSTVFNPALVESATSAINAGVPAAPTAAGMTVGEGMLYGNMINAGTQMVGGYLQGRSEEESFEDRVKRFSDLQANINIDSNTRFGAVNPQTSGQTPPTEFSLDDLRSRLGLMGSRT